MNALITKHLNDLQREDINSLIKAAIDAFKTKFTVKIKAIVDRKKKAKLVTQVFAQLEKDFKL